METLLCSHVWFHLVTSDVPDVVSAGCQLTIYALSPEQVLGNLPSGSNGCDYLG